MGGTLGRVLQAFRGFENVPLSAKLLLVYSSCGPLPPTTAFVVQPGDIGNELYRRHVWTAPSRQELFWRFGKRIRCGHVSGLFSRCISAGPEGIRGRGSKSWIRAVVHDVSDGMSRSRSLTDLPSHHIALSEAETEYAVHELKLCF